MTSRIEYEAVTPAGRTVFTSPDQDIARRWVFDRKSDFPGLIVEEVTTTITRRRVYRPVSYLRAVGT